MSKWRFRFNPPIHPWKYQVWTNIFYKNNITQTDDHQSACELIRSYSYDPKQNRSTTGFQTFDTGLFIHSLKTGLSKKILIENPELSRILFLIFQDICFINFRPFQDFSKKKKKEIPGLSSTSSRVINNCSDTIAMSNLRPRLN